MSITQFTMEEVRCFAGKQTLEIRPLTFLVGENSTGKTTALACFHIFANFLCGRGVDFNEKSSISHPYSMGTFREIVRNSKNKEKVFKLGFTSGLTKEKIEWIGEFTEREGRTEPTVSSTSVKFHDGEIVFQIGDEQHTGMQLVTFNQKDNIYKLVCDADIFDRYTLQKHLDILDDFSIKSTSLLDGSSEGKMALGKYLAEHSNNKRNKQDPWDLWRSLHVFSSSPIRSKPERTYDPMKEISDPEGSSIPMLLRRLETSRKKEWEALKAQLVEFGNKSGLFQDIKIKNFGNSSGGPFQMQFKVRGPTTNVMDVGYGVSQILPILVQVLYTSIFQSSQRKQVITNYSLLQQPEIHLHPRAQAEFSSLLVKLANQGNQSFIIETHSDYMIDRARIEIRKGTIKPEDVSLIYFEPKGNIVNVHNIGFDKMANMMGVPTHFRKFFIIESKRLMGFEE